jgi:subtilisin family serine protease
MPRRSHLFGLLVLFVVSLLFIPARPSSAAPAPGSVIPDQYIVQFDPNLVDVPARVQELAARHGINVDQVYEHAVKGFAGRIPARVLDRLRAEPGVVSVQEDRVVALEQTQSIPTGIRRSEATLSPTARINGVDERVNVDVAVIDTGIQGNHPDLNVAGGYNCVSTTRSRWGDGNGHGTHVAGTVGALDNGFGVVGVAPGARLWAVRVLNNQGFGSESSIICGLDWVRANASTIEVANMSLGGSGSDSPCGGSDAYHNAFCNTVNAGVTMVVAAGNSSADANNFRPATWSEAITVSALADFNGAPGGGAASTCRTDEDDSFANFSNFGSDVDIIAPGVCILSTSINSGYTTLSGTSMAAPHVAGAAALYKANNPGASPAQVRSALIGAGNFDWNNSDDRDSTKEPLLNARNF